MIPFLLSAALVAIVLAIALSQPDKTEAGWRDLDWRNGPTQSHLEPPDQTGQAGPDRDQLEGRAILARPHLHSQAGAHHVDSSQRT